MQESVRSAGLVPGRLFRKPAHKRQVDLWLVYPGKLHLQEGKMFREGQKGCDLNMKNKSSNGAEEF